MGAGDGCFTMGVGASVLSTSGGFRGFLIEGLGLKRCGVEGSTAHGGGRLSTKFVRAWIAALEQTLNYRSPMKPLFKQTNQT